MKRLVFLVEGDSELVFVNKFLVPYLLQRNLKNVSMNAQKIITNNKLQKKGGNISYTYLHNDLKRINGQGGVVITTFLDFFRLPNNFPGYESNNCDIIESEMAELENLPDYIPYIQKYEFETLLFSSMSGFNFVIDDERQLALIKSIIDEYDNPEDINGGATTSPSNRLLNIFPYQKVSDSELMLTEISIDNIREKCPRFDRWVETILNYNYA